MFGVRAWSATADVLLHREPELFLYAIFLDQLLPQSGGYDTYRSEEHDEQIDDGKDWTINMNLSVHTGHRTQVMTSPRTIAQNHVPIEHMVSAHEGV